MDENGNFIDLVHIYTHPGAKFLTEVFGEDFQINERESGYHLSIWNSITNTFLKERFSELTGKLINKQLKIFTNLWEFIIEHPQFANIFEDFVGKLELKIVKNQDITREELKVIFEKISKEFENIGGHESYQELIKDMADYKPYFWLELNPDEELYIEKYEPKFESYYENYLINGFDPYLNKIIRRAEKGYYHPDFHSNFVREQQKRILKKQWGGRCAMTGERILSQKITRHHFKIGTDINNKYYKTDCRISALVPIITTAHVTKGEPHTPQWKNRFEDAKFYIEQGIAYIPAWWNREDRDEYRSYLEKNKIPYVEGQVI
ncbi:MAG: hypothetical protein ACTSQJ_12475 [Promethearchaeota archaeon]